MDFGMFLEQTRRGASQRDAFLDMFALVDAAESWGLDVVWLAEMLVNPARSVLSAPLLVAIWVAAPSTLPMMLAMLTKSPSWPER